MEGWGLVMAMAAWGWAADAGGAVDAAVEGQGRAAVTAHEGGKAREAGMERETEEAGGEKSRERGERARKEDAGERAMPGREGAVQSIVQHKHPYPAPLRPSPRGRRFLVRGGR